MWSRTDDNPVSPGGRGPGLRLLGRSRVPGVAHHDVIPGLGHRVRGVAHHDGGRGRGRERGAGEECGALVFGQGVGVQVVAGAGQAGHAVAGGGAQTALGQMQSGYY